MPQFEIKHADDDAGPAKVRARSADDAVRRHFGLGDSASVSIDSGIEFDALSGWHQVRVDGQDIGEIRLFQRMRFRRA